MEEPRNRYILLHDRVGYILEKNMLAPGLSFTQSTPTQVLKGELLEALPEVEQPNEGNRIALAGIDRNTLSVECSMEDIARLTSEDADLLLAISSLGSRYETYTDSNRLNFGQRILPGSKVFVKVKGISMKLRGIVWYKGALPPNLGTMFGVELIKNPGLGTSDGTFGYRRYFTCKPDSGVFVGLDKLTPLEDSDMKSASKSPKRDENQNFFKEKNYQRLPWKRTDYELKIYQRVVTFVDDAPVRGTVLYIGKEKQSDGLVHTIVGLGLDKRCGSGTGERRGKQLFIAKQNYAAFVDIETVIPEKDFDGNDEEAATSQSEDHGGPSGAKMDQQEHKEVKEERTVQKELTEMQQQEIERARLPEQLGEKDMSMMRMEQQLRMTVGQQQNLQRQLKEMEQQLRKKDEQQQNLQRQLREMEQQLREKDEQQQNLQRQSREMEQQLTNCHGQLRQKDRQLTEKDEHLREKDEQLREKEVELTEKDEQLKEKDEEQENLQEQLGEMEQQLIEKEQREENLQRQLREMGQRLTHFEEQSREREEERANLQQQNVVLERQLRDKEEEVNELEISLSTIQRTVNEQRRQETCDWVIVRDEIQISEKCIGRGGWGSVYEGMYCGCTIAVKQIHELILSPHNRRLFEREMSIASRCRHPCLLQFIGATNDEGSPLFVTELMETSLRELLQQQQLSETEIAVISLDVAKALNYLHQKKPDPIIHRDVSSANVLLWRQGGQWRAKVSDYGTANFMQNTMTAAPGAMIYSAPEALTSKQTVKVDVYSFGVLLCEMSIRELPDPRRRDEQVALVTNRALRGLVRRCLETNAESRPSMLVIIDSLRQFNLKG